MSTDPSSPARNAGTHDQLRKKKIVVVVLVVLLAIALVWQPKSSKHPSTVHSVPKLEINVSSFAAQAGEDDASVEDFAVVNSLPRIDPKQIEITNLFQNAYFAPPPEPTADPESLDEPTAQYTVGAVYGRVASNQKAALVEGTIVRSGDRLPDVGNIISVSPTGITIAE